MKLLKLELNAFRGATKPFELEFDQSKKLTMVYGANGSGKTTIADALICLCTDGLGSIGDKSGVDPKFLKSFKANESDVYLRLHTEGGIFSATMSRNKLVKASTQNPFPNLRQLRRSKIMNFIEAVPSERYKELAGFIDVDSIFNSGEKLRALVRNLDNDLSREISIINSAKSTLENQWKQDSRPMGDWETWAKTESKKDIIEEQVKATKFGHLIKAWEDLNNQIDSVKSSAEALEEAENNLRKIQEEIELLSGGGQNATQNILAIFEHAKYLISDDDDIHECPLCSNPINRQELLKDITSYLDSVKEFQSASKRKEAANRVKDLAKTTFVSNHQVVESRIISFTTNWQNAYQEKLSFGETEAPTEKKIELFERQRSDLEKKIATASAEKSNSEQTIQKQKYIKTQYEAILKSTLKAEEIQELLNAARRALEIVDTSRKDYIDQELASISDEVDALYDILHPNENIGRIRLSLDQRFKNSLGLTAKFEDEHGIPPQSLYSESHLDTLGVCVFLALAKKYGAKETILLLDDVVNSVDENHLERFVELLHDLERDFAHIITTTHYRPWRNLYKNQRVPGDKVCFIELRDWSLASGIFHQHGKNQKAELNEALVGKYYDRQVLAGKAGILLENILMFLVQKYSCKLRYKPKQDYTLGELLDAILSKLSKALTVEVLTKNEETGKYELPIKETTQLQAYFETLKKLSFIRNWVGAHFNQAADDVSDPDIKLLATTTLELALKLTCPENGEFPNKSDSGSYHETKSKSLRLHPFQ